MALKAERAYALRVLPGAVFDAIRAAIVHRTVADVERAAAIVLGFGLTSAGYLAATLNPVAEAG